MEWTWRESEEFAEMMETYEFVEPAMERIVRQDAQAEEFHERLRALERRVKELEALPHPQAKYGLGDRNALLGYVKERANHD
jgi:hypothetical protein